MNHPHSSSLNQGIDQTDSGKIPTTESTGDLCPGFVDFRNRADRARSHSPASRSIFEIGSGQCPRTHAILEFFNPTGSLKDRRIDTKP